MELRTKEQLRWAIKSAKRIMVQPRVGHNAQWVRTSKKDAQALADALESAERLGTLDGDTVYIG